MALVIVGPRVIHLIRTFDLSHHLDPADLARQGGPFRAAISGTHVSDLLNLVALLSPVALATLVLPFTLGRVVIARRVGLVLAALLIPLFALMLVIRPQQGIFRDLDVFAPSAIAISVVAAWLVGETIRRSQAAWLAAPVALACIASTASWLELNHDSPRGMAWVKSFVTEPPGRSDDERALTWDYLGFRASEADQWAEAAQAYAHAAETAPSPRILTLWGMAETMTGRLDQARDLYRKALALDPNSRLALRGLASTSYRLGDYAEARRAAIEMRRRGIEAPELVDLMRSLDSLGVERTPQENRSSTPP